MSDIKATRVDTISAQVPVPADLEATNTFLGLLTEAASEGYAIKSCAAITSGHQRDPYTVGLKITMQRGS